MGQEVFLLNPKNYKQSIASGIISGLGGQDKFHFQVIQDSCYKVDVKEAIWPQVSLMFPNQMDEQTKVKDTVGSSAIWEAKFIKSAKWNSKFWYAWRCDRSNFEFYIVICLLKYSLIYAAQCFEHFEDQNFEAYFFMCPLFVIIYWVLSCSMSFLRNGLHFYE